MIGKIASLHRYLIKGCAQTPLTEAEFGREGVLLDRRFMLVSTVDGTFLSQRKKPRMAIVHPEWTDGGLLVRAEGMADLLVPTVVDGARRDVSLFNKWFGEGVDQGDEAAAWFSTVLDVDCRLVRTPPDLERPGWGDTAGFVGFADAHALMVCSLSSLDDLNNRIVANGGQAVPMNRFRPNIVIDGWDEPFAEDYVRTMRSGDLELAHSARAIRCPVPTVDQQTGERCGPEPTKTLATFRREPVLGGGVSFGVKFAVANGGSLRVGDTIEVTDTFPEGYVVPKP